MHRGGFGVSYRTRLLRGEATASFLMDHGRFGPPGLAGGLPGAPNEIEVCQSGSVTRPAHRSKGEGYTLAAGDWVQVHTPGGGGYGDPRERPRARIARDLHNGYLTADDAARDYGMGVAHEDQAS
jgi:N-methylhydantoinase B